MKASRVRTTAFSSANLKRDMSDPSTLCGLSGSVLRRYQPPHGEAAREIRWSTAGEGTAGSDSSAVGSTQWALYSASG